MNPLHVGATLLALAVIVVLAFVAAFLRIVFTRHKPEGGDVALHVDHGFAQSEIGLTWAELARIPNLKLVKEWGSGMLALAVRERVSKVEAREAALLVALQAIATCEPTGRNSLVKEAQRAIAENQKSRADGEAADAGPWAGPRSAEGKDAAR